MISFKVGKAVTAQVYEQKGEEFDPQFHVIVTPVMELESEFVKKLLSKYTDHMVAYMVLHLEGGSYCLEIQYDDDEIGQNLMAEYDKAFKKGGEIYEEKKKLKSKAKRRLICDRMYILEDGREFWYYGKWDNFGNLVGKVLSDEGYRPNPKGKIMLENMIIHRSRLENAQIVPIDKERWSLR